MLRKVVIPSIIAAAAFAASAAMAQEIRYQPFGADSSRVDAQQRQIVAEARDQCGAMARSNTGPFGYSGCVQRLADGEVARSGDSQLQRLHRALPQSMRYVASRPDMPSFELNTRIQH